MILSTFIENCGSCEKTKSVCHCSNKLNDGHAFIDVQHRQLVADQHMIISIICCFRRNKKT